MDDGRAARYDRRFPPDPRYQVVFSRADGCRGWIDGLHWRAELYEHGPGHDGHASHPVAVAWVTEYPGPPGAILDFVTVPDQWRGRGLAPRLVAECYRRWPGLWQTGRLAADGEFRAGH